MHLMDDSIYVVTVENDSFEVETFLIEEETETIITAHGSKDSILLINKVKDNHFKCVSGKKLFFDGGVEESIMEEVLPLIKL